MEVARRWHMLQISDVLDEELSTALGRTVAITGWVPESDAIGALIGSNGRAEALPAGPGFHTRSLPMLRGFAKMPARLGSHLAKRIVKWISSVTEAPAQDVLVCTTPFFAGVAEHWPGPVVYWLTDLIAQYESARGIDVPSLDRRMCDAATLVCPNSARLAEYLKEQGCAEEKIVITPNATRRVNTLPSLLTKPLTRHDLANDPRPIAGVIGNLAGNMDWALLDAAILRTPWLRWTFVGPTGMQIRDPDQRRAREKVQRRENTNFVGKRPYGELAEYARSFHVAVLPYLKCEPTYSGSSTRFYEHLAACRPMLATRGFEELLRKEPLLTLVDTVDEVVGALEDLRDHDFDDGVAEDRWKASQSATWETRAETMQSALSDRLLAR